MAIDIFFMVVFEPKLFIAMNYHDSLPTNDVVSKEYIIWAYEDKF